MEFATVPRQIVKARFQVPLDFAAQSTTDLWVDVTDFGTTFAAGSETIIFPDVRKVQVDVTAREGLSMDSADGMFTVQSSAFTSEGTAETFNASTAAKAASRSLGLEREQTTSVIPAYSIKNQKTGAVNLSSIDNNNRILDEKYEGVSPPFMPVAKASDNTYRVYMHAGKLISMNGDAPSSNGSFVADATITVWYSRQVREEIQAAVDKVGSEDYTAPVFPPILSREQIFKIKSRRVREATLLAWASGYDVIQGGFSVTNFFQHVVGFVKAAAPIIVTALGMLKELPPMIKAGQMDDSSSDEDDDPVCDWSPGAVFQLHHATIVNNSSPAPRKRGGSKKKPRTKKTPSPSVAVSPAVKCNVRRR